MEFPFYDGQEVIVKAIGNNNEQYCIIDGQDEVFDCFLNKIKTYITFNSCYPKRLTFYFATCTGKGFYPYDVLISRV